MEFGLELKKCSLLILDGAVVMIGVYRGVAVYLKEVNFRLIFTYCLCYKIVLICIDISN